MPPKLGRGWERGGCGHQLSRQCSPSQPPSTSQHFPNPGWRQNQDERVDSLLLSSHREQPSLISIGNEVRDWCHGGNHPESCATMGHKGHRTIPVAAAGSVLMDRPPLPHCPPNHYVFPLNLSGPSKAPLHWGVLWKSKSAGDMQPPWAAAPIKQGIFTNLKAKIPQERYTGSQWSPFANVYSTSVSSAFPSVSW